ncbi:hypothetical protein LG047_12720 [Methylocystis sp. WRRC1]|uniref:hypothetical protein n=1 Tax=unclassified Methylocystis TaxID=2625913 RepID=UPI0001F86849|nr:MULTISPECIES: hypothetical protein [unclassified Methylocystis]MCC3246173.1 hypothetical protein [Methylocystis sp. WRRC1]
MKRVDPRVTELRTRGVRFLCEGEAVDTQFVDLVFVVEARVGESWLAFAKGKDVLTFHNFSNAEAFRRQMARRYRLEKAA